MGGRHRATRHVRVNASGSRRRPGSTLGSFDLDQGQRLGHSTSTRVNDQDRVNAWVTRTEIESTPGSLEQKSHKNRVNARVTRPEITSTLGSLEQKLRKHRFSGRVAHSGSCPREGHSLKIVPPTMDGPLCRRHGNDGPLDRAGASLLPWDHATEPSAGGSDRGCCGSLCDEVARAWYWRREAADGCGRRGVRVETISLQAVRGASVSAASPSPGASRTCPELGPRV